MKGDGDGFFFFFNLVLTKGIAMEVLETLILCCKKEPIRIELLQYKLPPHCKASVPQP